MVVCKFFLHGFCKFGENCRYQHYEDNRSQVANYQSHNRSWQSPSYAQGGRTSSQANARPPNSSPGHLNPLDLCTAIKEDIAAMEEGGQWPLSCYTPLKDIGCFPGFHDTSMEEVRYEAYQAQASGTFDQYVKKMRNSIQATRMKWAMLKNPSGQVMSVIEKMARGQMGGPAVVHGAPSFSLQPAAVSSSGNFPAADGGSSQSSSVASNFRFSLTSCDSASFPQAFVGQSGDAMFNSAARDAALPSVTLLGGDVPLSGFIGAQTVFEKPPQAEGSSLWTTSQKIIPAAFADANIYSNLADLTDAEKKEFTAMTFILGFVPLRPPPCEMCS